MQNLPTPTIKTLIVFISILIGVEIQAQSPDLSGKSYAEPFNINNPFEFDLIFNFKSFLKAKNSEEFIEAKIAYKNDEGTMIEKKVEIRSRGNVRKQICYLPPIRIDFTDEDYQVDLFNEFGKVKLVSTCKVAANHEPYVIKEFLAYKIYELLTEFSFKTYSLKINFIDSEGKRKPFSSYSFIIEDIDKVAERNNAVEVENQGLLPVHMDRQTMNLFSMYQYLIGNVDWHIPNLHNVKLIKSLDHKKPSPLPIPYDLDYCGLVNTNYSVPREGIPIESVTERYWIGNCLQDGEYEDVIQVFLDKKEDILKLFEDCEFLEKYNKTTSVRYIDQFFQLIEKGEQAKYIILKDCN